MGWFDNLFDRGPKIAKSKVAGVADLTNKGFKLHFTHVPSNESVWFPAFIESFSDAYNSEWNAEQVFGRMDPIATFMNTRRAISVAWTIPSDSPQNAIDNLEKIGKLMSFLYPAYRAGTGATTITMGPLMKLKFGNLIQDSDTGGALLGYVNGFTMDPLLDEGMHTWELGADSIGAPMKMKGKAGETGGILPRGIGNPGVQYIPKTVRLNCEFAVLHQHPLGWHGSKLRGGNAMGFPYGKDQFKDLGLASTKVEKWEKGFASVDKDKKTKAQEASVKDAKLSKALKK